MLVSSVVAALAAIALVVLAAVTFRRFGRADGEPEGATAGHAGAMLSALFLIFFAIALIVPWTSSDEETKTNAAAAQSLVEAYWDTTLLPAADRGPVREEIRGYLRYVRDREWPRLADGADSLDAEGWRRLDALRTRLAGVRTTDEQMKDARDDAVERVREVYSARRQTAANLGDVLPASVLVLTILTGLLMIVFPWLAGARPAGMPLVLLGVMAAVLGVSLSLCLDLNNLFGGSFTVRPDAYTDALAEVARIP
ncbi:DUF4239 domain-containing protein [Actinomadura kijaniata]|uniref:DUF4239 domain-containing protein n=1 Tax=Actinomadura namibiensis TaxID=182080 RepID=A0A7W3QL46_ACTNM|nr:DUF4239 domain-containing protein [Actinomadura namibiensis]MBA8951194.1 hypothetical protein [Actinomadura namibiensis]